MTLAVLDAPRRAPIPGTPRPTAAPIAEPLPELTEEQWAQIQARLRATGVPVESEDDGALARTLGASALLGLALTGLAACGLWSLLA